MKKYLYWTGIFLSVALASYFVYFAIGALRQYGANIVLTSDLVIAMVAAAFMYALCTPLSGWAWHILLRGMGSTWRPGTLASIMGITQLAKYIPGNIGQHIGRTALSLAKGMSVGLYTGSVLLETLLAMLSGLFVGVLFALLSPVSMPNLFSEHQTAMSALVIILIFCVLALPWILQTLIHAVCRSGFLTNLIKNDLKLPAHKDISIAALWYCINYILIGCGLWLISSTISDGIQLDFFYLTSVFALSWLLGFVTPGAPAGIGVREGVMVILLSGLATNDIVLLIVTAMRIATMTGDGIVFIGSAIYIQLSESRHVQ
jgi:hypothetical protein